MGLTHEISYFLPLPLTPALLLFPLKVLVLIMMREAISFLNNWSCSTSNRQGVGTSGQG